MFPRGCPALWPIWAPLVVVTGQDNSGKSIRNCSPVWTSSDLVSQFGVGFQDYVKYVGKINLLNLSVLNNKLF